MSRQEVLVIGRMMPFVVKTLKERYDVVELEQEADRAGFLVAEGGRFKAAACGLAGVDRETIKALPNLQIIAAFGVGYDGVDVKAVAEAGVVVTNTPDVLTEEVVDIALALMIMAVRELNVAEHHLCEGRWTSEGLYPLARGSLQGATLGIFGLGRIGKAIARRVEACGMEIRYHGRHEQAGVPLYLSRRSEEPGGGQRRADGGCAGRGGNPSHGRCGYSGSAGERRISDQSMSAARSGGR